MPAGVTVPAIEPDTVALTVCPFKLGRLIDD
jgi:hypothetical protein